MKRQRGRNRNGGGQKPQQHNANRAFDSNGPEGIKVRGNAQHVFEKYQQLARDAQSGGDRVLAENYLQHAEHYFRLIRVVTPTRAVSDIVGRDAIVSGIDIDFEDESGAQAIPEQPENDGSDGGDQPQQQSFRQDNGGGQRNNNNNDYQRNRDRDRNFRDRDDRPRDRDRDDRPRDRDDRPRDDRPRDDRPRDDRPRDDRPRDDRPRDDRPRDDRPRDDRPRDDRPREDKPREDRPRDDRPREERPRYRDRDDRPRDRAPREERADPMAVVEPQATPLPRTEDAPKRLRADDGESHMPAFLSTGRKPKAQAAPPADAPADTEAKPKRRRAPKAADTE